MWWYTNVDAKISENFMVFYLRGGLLKFDRDDLDDDTTKR